MSEYPWIISGFNTSNEEFLKYYNYVLSVAEEVGMEVNENVPIDFKFIAELVRRLTGAGKTETY